MSRGIALPQSKIRQPGVEGEIMDNRIVIIVQGGRIQHCFAALESTRIEIIDFDEIRLH
jgi:hypothetical protein